MDKPKKMGKPPIYSPELKIAVAREYLSGNLGYGMLAKKHNLKSGDCVRYMVSWYQKRHSNATETTADNQPGCGNEIKLLQQADLKIIALEMLIENASKELGVDLVKKFGSKQSKK